MVKNMHISVWDLNFVTSNRINTPNQDEITGTEFTLPSETAKKQNKIYESVVLMNTRL